MIFFRCRTVLHPGISRNLPGYFLLPAFMLIVAISVSCNNKSRAEAKTGRTPAPKIAKTVPGSYYMATDKGFSVHQDTVFYNNNFFTGYRYTLYPGGDTAWLQSYFNGVEEGIQKKWYPDRQLAEERFYINGKKEGMHRGWWPDGKPKFQFSCDLDEYEGEFTEWYPSGLLGKKFHYVNGKEEGSQRLWWDNGTVRANYVVKHGKKYGLIGLKICDNPYDSVIKK